ncbi:MULTISPECIES: Crp/Fnr family transcriptional regulator [Bradyrhizobium]|uniref:cAMP-binding domain of CRP or a regulatory subunit of cAMP-dependent protein kinases n=1 Tax=Bradyrhizobium brasilense TaxID=1419277 RepID=A0A1G7PDV4_9BRAD|nr:MULTISPECIES: Crp/Fnr family transcriptional regulator [Bradyrhizobium]MBP2433916.1 CRP-like cAMP-binding protein [Bradyrhizobium elkanii]MBR1159975.1 Crp/Fnr family transcriptional regulator [Bradyrhizobium elkanii]MCA6104410.1 Crp/Fnr family transcriptional regulator [Bradyrhizobium australafricanum]MCC8975762.1 Crp/Fnr family transcriptional regulator [Bradyrhizobium brasilense]WLA85698.1 Crp/Fnr family transcriptional regulator [Bradyrhizobium elkanii]
MPIEMMIRKLRLHSELPDENIEALRSIVTPVKDLPEDSVIVREGDLSTQCCVVMSGFAYRSKVSETGKRQILSFHIAGDMPDLQGLPLKRMDHDLTTLSQARLGFINHDALERILDSRPALVRALWRETLVDAALFRQWIVNLGTRSAAGRMAYLIAELRQRLAAMGLVANEQFDFPITQSKLADALGLSVVHVNRVLQAFRADGVLDLKRRVVTLRDLEKIVELGGFETLDDHGDTA